MFVNAGSIDDGATLDCDVCVIGAGAAGLTVAHELAGSGLSVVVVAGGGKRRRARDQALYRGTVIDPEQHSWADRFRERRYGGTTAIWGGRCLPYDAIDFETRSYVPHSGWPFGRETLDPYYARAAVYCEIGAPLFDAALALPDRPAALLPGFDSPAVTSTSIERFSRPTDFGALLERRLRAAATVRVLLDAHCIGLVGTPNGGAIEQVRCATFKPSRFAIRARFTVVAAGGLETARLLLAARAQSEAPLAIESSWLGHGYMGHLNGTIGEIQFTRPPEQINYGYEMTPDGIYCRRRFWITPAVQRELGLLNVMFRLHHPPINDPAHHQPVLSAMYLVKDLVLYEYSRKMREGRSLRNLLGHVRNVVAHPLALSRFGVDWIDRRLLRSRQLPSVALYSPTGHYSIEFHSEQAPDPGSRVILGEATDRFGMPELVIDWRAGAIDVLSVQRAYGVLQRAFAATDAGELRLDPAGMATAIRRDGAVGGHHLGTVRMADRIERGVVDSQCRLFGIQNGFVASGAALPTSSQANPTLTIVALAVRLADHLKRLARAAPAVDVRARRDARSALEPIAS